MTLSFFLFFPVPCDSSLYTCRCALLFRSSVGKHSAHTHTELSQMSLRGNFSLTSYLFISFPTKAGMCWREVIWGGHTQCCCWVCAEAWRTEKQAECFTLAWELTYVTFIWLNVPLSLLVLLHIWFYTKQNTENPAYHRYFHLVDDKKWMRIVRK